MANKLDGHLFKIETTEGPIFVKSVEKFPVRYKCPLESKEAKDLWSWSQYHPIARDHLLHIPNEQKTSWANGKKLKAEGRRKGVSDYFLAYPCGGKGGLWIELKRRDKRVSRLSEEQAAWLAQCVRVGYEAKVAYGAEEAIKSIEDYLN